MYETSGGLKAYLAEEWRPDDQVSGNAHIVV